MIAQAYSSVHFPIMPLLQKSEDGTFKLYRRNFNLFTPRDFDYSPYFEVIKYTFFGSDDLSYYRRLPWDENGVYCDNEIISVIVADPKPEDETPTVETIEVVDEQEPEIKSNAILNLIRGKKSAVVVKLNPKTSPSEANSNPPPDNVAEFKPKKSD